MTTYASVNDVAQPPSEAEVAQALRHVWFPVARASDLEDGVPHEAMLLGEPLVAFRGEDGELGVLSDRCPHRGAALSMGKVVGDAVQCPYHGWRWRAGDGRCIRIPSLHAKAGIPPGAAAKAYACKEHLGHVWVALDTPAVDVWDPPELRGDSLVYDVGAPLRSSAGLRTVVENFRDVAHFPFVHHRTFGDTEQVVEPLAIRRDGFEIYMEREFSLKGEDEHVWPENLGWTYHATLPATVSIELRVSAGTRYVTHMPSPVNDEFTDIYFIAGYREGYDLVPLEQLMREERSIYEEDVPIINRIRPRQAPLDTTTEVHSPADAYTLTYRRAFADFVRWINESRPQMPSEVAAVES